LVYNPDREKAYAIGNAARPGSRQPAPERVNVNRRGANAAREVDSKATCSGSRVSAGIMDIVENP
jgi:hypothetical protein